MKIKFDYTLVGDVYFPNFTSIDTNYEIGIWGQRHKNYLKQNHRVIYYNLLTQNKLNSYLHDIDVKARKMYDDLIHQLAEKQGITEEFKADDTIAWVQAMNNISYIAREIVCDDILYK